MRSPSTIPRDRKAPASLGARVYAGPAPEVGRSLFRRVASEQLEPAVEGIVRGWLDQREDNETFTAFQRRLSDDELGVLADLEPARKRPGRESREETVEA